MGNETDGVEQHLPDLRDAPASATPTNVDANSWQRLGRGDWLLVFILAGPLSFLLPLSLAQVGGLFAEGAATRLLLWAVSFVLIFAVMVLVQRLRTPGVWVRTADRRVRAGRRSIAWGELTSAELVPALFWPGGKRTLVLLLHGPGTFRAPIVLRRRGAAVLGPTGTVRADALVAGSSIEVPRAAEDPDGRFSRWNFPSHVSRETALALIADPPADGDPLPLPQ